jgi:hypothetical protein
MLVAIIHGVNMVYLKIGGITVDLIENLIMPNATGEWNWESISMYISTKEILLYRDYRWYRGSLSHNKGITLHIADNSNASDKAGRRHYPIIMTPSGNLDMILSNTRGRWD